MKNVLMVFALMCSMVTSVQAQGGGGYGGLKTAAEQKIQQAEQAIWSAIAAYNSTQALLDGIVVMPPYFQTQAPWNHTNNTLAHWNEYTDAQEEGAGELSLGQAAHWGGQNALDSAIEEYGAALTAYNATPPNYYGALLAATEAKGLADFATTNFVLATGFFSSSDSAYDLAKSLYDAAVARATP